MFVFIFLLSLGTEWPPIGKVAAHSAYDMFSWYKCLIVNLVYFPPRFLERDYHSDCAFLLVSFEVNDIDSPAGEEFGF